MKSGWRWEGGGPRVVPPEGGGTQGPVTSTGIFWKGSVSQDKLIPKAELAAGAQRRSRRLRLWRKEGERERGFCPPRGLVPPQP